MPGYSSFSTQWSLVLKCIDLTNIAFQKLIDLTNRLVYRLTQGIEAHIHGQGLVNPVPVEWNT